MYHLAAPSAGPEKYTDWISSRGIRPPLTSVLDMTLNNLMMSSNITGALWNVEHFFIAISPDPLCRGVVAPDRVLCMSQIELLDF